MGVKVCSRRRIAAVALLLAACFAAFFAGTAQAQRTFSWLCKPGLSNNPCEAGLKTSLLDNSGNVEKVLKPKEAAHRKVDCFYVYPTVSDQDTPNANLHKDPEINSIALYQAARYSQYCKVYAPVYRQLTIKEIGQANIPQHVVNVAYNSALAAWKAYLRKFNDGRDFVLLGHSQGSFTLRKLIADEIDTHRALRKHMLSAILLGGNVNGDQAFGDHKSKRVPPGDFKHIPPCRSAAQLHCVMGFSTFNAPVPSDSLFGRTTLPGHKVLCTNPAALDGGESLLKIVSPSEPFAPGTTIGIATKAVGLPEIDVNTPFWEYDDAYSGQCSSLDGASVLQVAPQPDAPVLHAIPDQTWGLHLVDGNIALGNFVDVVHREIQAAK